MPASISSFLTTALLVGAFVPALAQQGDGTRVPLQTHVVKPALVELAPERIGQLRAPAGFRVDVYANGLRNIRILAAAPDGGIYVSRREQGDVLYLRDRDGDGRADGNAIVVARRPGMHGLAVHAGKLYMATV
jgi:glucose/arabinose dehydrogenase